VLAEAATAAADLPLRFCMVTTFYPPYHFGGDAIGIQRLARALVRRGHDVTVVHDVDAFSTLAHHTPAGQTGDDGVRVVPLRSGFGGISSFLTHQLGQPILTRSKLRALLAPGNFDVVNFHNVSLIGGPGVLSYGGNAVKLYMAHEHWLVCPTHVLWRHGRERCTGRECLRCTLHYHRPPQIWRATNYLAQQLAGMDAIITMSEFSRAKHREFGLERDTEVLPYFLPDPAPGVIPRSLSGDAAPAPAGERPYFLFVGRLEKIKGLDDVIPAFRDYPDADLVIAGDGEYAATLRALAGDAPNVRFLGRISPEDLRGYYERAIALIVPSECFETFGIVLIESFREGTPVIARRLGPFPEIVAQSNGGELFWTREELIAAMRRLQFDATHRRQLARDGFQAYLSRWTESAVVPRYLDIVHRALARRHGVIQPVSHSAAEAM
jgi:glycosyltransferase involved in cell wall biosynthesis